jgi:hypothetical protein
MALEHYCHCSRSVQNEDEEFNSVVLMDLLAIIKLPTLSLWSLAYTAKGAVIYTFQVQFVWYS